jgi:dipeptidyl aminopeptidase/acylaminoacyl peptidase
LEAPFTGLKVANTSSGDLRFLMNSLAYPNGTAYNAELAVTPAHTGRFYENIYPRHWDTWLTKERYAVFAGTLLANSSYSLAHSGMRNLLQGINFTATRPESPVQPFGDGGDYDISPDGSIFAFLSKAPHLSKANYTASYVYLGSLESLEPPVAFNGPESEAYEAGHQGASGLPSFSPDGSKLAYAQQDGDYYESDRQQLYVIDVAVTDGSVSTSNYTGLTPNWDRWVSGIHWAPDSESVYVLSEDWGINRAFNIPLSANDDFKPQNLTGTTSVTDFAVLPDSTLLVGSTSVWSSRDIYTVTSDGPTNMLFSATEVDEELAGLGPETYSEIFFDGSLPDLEQKIHALVVKPSNFVENKTYPLAYIIHGGPQGSNTNRWSTGWNFQTWADQGYIVVAPNPTGSTGFGQYLIDAIQGEWGSYPYEDVVLGWEYVKENLPFVDTENGIVAGASYGGYMTNWIQGHDLGNEFKAIITHDGISQTKMSWASEELWFMRHDFNGSYEDPEATYDLWNPLNHIGNWSTPQFIIHNTLDYRLPESDGLQLFNILQAKGIPSRFLNFPDENHWVLGYENSLFWHQEIFNWINHYAKGEDLDTVPVGE